VWNLSLKALSCDAQSNSEWGIDIILIMFYTFLCVKEVLWGINLPSTCVYGVTVAFDPSKVRVPIRIRLDAYNNPNDLHLFLTALSLTPNILPTVVIGYFDIKFSKSSLVI